jgi:hypothetical protein
MFTLTDHKTDRRYRIVAFDHPRSGDIIAVESNINYGMKILVYSESYQLDQDAQKVFILKELP